MSLTEREKEVLEIIETRPTSSREEIAEKLDISSSAVGTYIHKLTNKGYLLGKGYIVAPKRKVVVVGGSNIDLKAYVKDEYLAGTSNPGYLTDSLGGVGRNIAENLGILGQPTILLSAVGDDNYGDRIIEETAKSTLNLDYVMRSKDYGTGTYLAHLDEEGDLVGAIADMEILAEINQEYLNKHQQIIEQASLLVLDANLKQQTINYLLELVAEKDIPVVVEPVSVSKGRKFIDKLDSIDVLTPNLDEAIEILGLDYSPAEIKADLTLLEKAYQEQDLSTTLVISLGLDGIAIIDQQGTEILAAYNVTKEEIVETTGAGDALTAGVIYGLAAEDDLVLGAKLGLQAAKLTIMNQRTVNLDLKQNLRDGEFNELFRY